MDNGERVWREQGLRSAVLAGDERAWQTWYDESFAGLYAYVSWRCAGRRQLAEEVVQDTWLIAVRQVRRFDPGQGSFAGWLRGIAANVLRNQWRKQLRLGRHTQSLNGAMTGHGSVTPPPVSRDLAERIARALAALSDRHEAVLRAKYLDQQSVAQIAAAWNETPKAVESLLTRARQAFRESYEKLE
jgi:RNA polymerase sigma-70 factor (ECF subfamily)